MQDTSSSSKNILHHNNITTDFLLAVMPVMVVIGVLLLLNLFGTQEVLFSSLASSAFLIYLDPKHPANSVRTLVVSQLSASVIGYLVYLFLGAGYVSAAVSMVIVIAVMILTKSMHPPAVSTALVFAFQHTKPNTLLMFFLAVGLLVILVLLQRMSIWLISRRERKKEEYERNR